MSIAFDPTTVAADAAAVFGDTAPAEVRYDFYEAQTRIGRAVVVRRFLGCTLAVAVAVADHFTRVTL